MRFAALFQCVQLYHDLSCRFVSITLERRDELTDTGPLEVLAVR